MGHVPPQPGDDSELTIRDIIKNNTAHDIECPAPEPTKPG